MHNFLFLFETEDTECFENNEFRDKLDIALIITITGGKSNILKRLKVFN